MLFFHRENGADSILDLGLLDAPEKTQVNSLPLLNVHVSGCLFIK